MKLYMGLCTKSSNEKRKLSTEASNLEPPIKHKSSAEKDYIFIDPQTFDFSINVKQCADIKKGS